MNIIFYIDDGQHLLGHTQEITCIELDLLVYLIKHIFLWDFEGTKWCLATEATKFGRSKHLTRSNLKS